MYFLIKIRKNKFYFYLNKLIITFNLYNKITIILYMTTLEIIGYILFVVSEIVAVLPIPANGLFHSFVIGLNNSIKNSNTDVEVAQQLVSTRPNTANLFNKIAIDSELSNTIQRLSDNHDILPYIEILTHYPQLKYIIALLQNNPDIVNDVKELIETNITQHQIQRQIVQQQIVQQRQLILQNQPFISNSLIENELQHKLQQQNSQQQNSQQDLNEIILQ